MSGVGRHPLHPASAPRHTCGTDSILAAAPPGTPGNEVLRTGDRPGSTQDAAGGSLPENDPVDGDAMLAPLLAHHLANAQKRHPSALPRRHARGREEGQGRLWRALPPFPRTIRTGSLRPDDRRCCGPRSEVRAWVPAGRHQPKLRHGLRHGQTVAGAPEQSSAAFHHFPGAPMS